jgi:hypothetical protein
MPDGAPKAQEQVMGSGFTVYYFVDSIEEVSEHLLKSSLAFLTTLQASDRIHKAGGKTVLPKMEQGDDGWFANLVDVEGNRFGIYQLRPEKLL